MAPEKGPKIESKDDLESKKEKKSSFSGKITTFVKTGLNKTKREAIEAQRDLKHSLGLGHKPNTIPPGKADINGEPRDIQLGWHPVAGATGKWFAEKTIIGRGIKERVGKYPDPTQHWAVIVGEYVHQLWMDENLDVIYFNEAFKPEEWTVFDVGKTRFNDQALRKASIMTIHLMREKRPAYNLISNNCQNFAVNLLDKVQLGAHKEFATSLAVYQKATGDGEVMDLWEKHPQEQIEHDALKADEEEQPKPKRQGTLQLAQQVMDENTTELDDHHD
ncbi:uncharacterized protein LTR77_006569 [Saxophila tyrrhenica]|uniref:PPPDE domain-containing protein n=1 Tax=Saxophila tyrrhenica TaxID=1690608 RepID=A0AAV9P580_9PEZI|nr:hypothetical protein LTR77_006569 [Saxophila tyrrhenica]